MSFILKRIKQFKEAVGRFGRETRSFLGFAIPGENLVREWPEISLGLVMELYEKDPACKASVDLLAMAAVGMGFYTTVNPDYAKADEAKQVVDEFNESVNLDSLLQDGARALVACGNDFWLKITPSKIEELIRLSISSIKEVKRDFLDLERGIKVPYKVISYELTSTYGGAKLKPEAIIHFKLNSIDGSGFGTGVLQVLLEELAFNGEKRPAYAEMKARIESVMPDIFKKYAGPDVVVMLEKATPEEINKFISAVRARPKEGAWYAYNKPIDVRPVQLDPRARFEFYVDHIINQVYLGGQTPLPKLFTTPGFTEASAKAALDVADMLVRPIQRYIKRLMERHVFVPVLEQAGYDPREAQCRLNWGMPEAPEPKVGDMLRAAELGLIRPEEFRKNVVKFGWELWEGETPETAED